MEFKNVEMYPINKLMLNYWTKLNVYLNDKVQGKGNVTIGVRRLTQ